MIDEIETSPLKRAREKRKQMAENGIKIQIKNPIEKARDNPRSLRLAVNAMCYDCVGQDHDTGTRKRIRECAAEGVCPLHPLRPYQNKSGSDEDETLD